MKIVCVLNRKENSKEIDWYYLNAIKSFGAVPILIDEKNLELLEICGGILLTGGNEKGSLDNFLIEYAIKNNLPLLGICQGMQSMGLYKTNQKLEVVEGHYKVNHDVIINKSRLKDIIKEDKIIVNSYHHQHIKSSQEFRVVAYSSDNVIEALERTTHPFQIGVEWHPERMLESSSSKRLFQEFINQIKK